MTGAVVPFFGDRCAGQQQRGGNPVTPIMQSRRIAMHRTLNKWSSVLVVAALLLALLPAALFAQDAAPAGATGEVFAEGFNGPEPVNLGSGNEIAIKDLVNLIARLTGFNGKIIWDASKPNGQPRRGLDTTRAWEYFGFRAQMTFEEGLRRTIDWYRANKSQIK
jgi:hypothetical protein